MTCRELDGFLHDYVSGALAAPVRVRFESHLAACRACAAYLASYRRTIALGRSLCEDDPDGPIPAAVPEPLVAAILAARRREPV